MAATLLLVLLQNLAVAKRRVVAHQRDGVPLQRLGMLHAEGRDVSRPLLHSLRESARCGPTLLHIMFPRKDV